MRRSYQNVQFRNNYAILVMEIIAFIVCLVGGIFVELIGSTIGIHYGSIVSIAIMGAFIIRELKKNQKK